MRGTWSGPAHPRTIAQLRRSVAEFAATGGFHGDRLDDLRTCVSEAVTNAVVHGYRDGRAPGTIEVRAAFIAEGLEVVVADDGVGYAPRTDSPGLGMGMLTIETFATSLALDAPRGGGTTLRMLFAIDR